MNTEAAQFNERQAVSPPSSSDEKMDTGSESFISTQNTPNSNISSDTEEKGNDDVLRLQNPEEPVLRLSDPINKLRKTNLNDSFVSKMADLKLDTPERPNKLGISPPRLTSTLTLVNNHPLMGVGSPNAIDNFPDVIPKIYEEKDSSISLIEDDRINNFSLLNYGPQRNTSKNNLYFSENFSTSDSIDGSHISAPGVAKEGRKKLILFRGSDASTPIRAEHTGRDTSQKEMAKSEGDGSDVPEMDEHFHSGVAEWCDSPSQLRSMPNFQLPIEMSTNISNVTKEQESPDLLSTSTQEDRSSYQATLDPYSGNVVLKHTPAPPAKGLSTSRRKIELPPEEDSLSSDGSACSLDLEEEPADLENQADTKYDTAEDGLRNSPSSHSRSTSSPIQEYSAAEELEEERACLRVTPSRKADMKVIEPYKRALSHGGYTKCGCAIIVFSACHLPPRNRTDYSYVMEQFFLYVIWSVERLVTDEYMLVYLHGSAAPQRLPSLAWIHDSYKLIDRRLRKSLKHLYLVHPTFWIKSIVLLSKPFLSSKFSKKLSYVKNLDSLFQQIPVDPHAIPDIVKQYDSKL